MQPQEILSQLLREIGFPDLDPVWVQVVGALIFTADSPMTFARLRELLPEINASQLEQTISALFALHSCLGISLQRMGGGYIFTTAPNVASWVRRAQGSRGGRLTQAALETLAIVAYRQPVTLPEINEIRGVDSETTLKYLIERNLVDIAGRRAEPGRPHLYVTTREFLTVFGLNSLSELPTFEESVSVAERAQEKLSLEDMPALPSSDFELDFSMVRNFEERVRELSQAMNQKLGLDDTFDTDDAENKTRQRLKPDNIQEDGNDGIE